MSHLPLHISGRRRLPNLRCPSPRRRRSQSHRAARVSRRRRRLLLGRHHPVSRQIQRPVPRRLAALVRKRLNTGRKPPRPLPCHFAGLRSQPSPARTARPAYRRLRNLAARMILTSSADGPHPPAPALVAWRRAVIASPPLRAAGPGSWTWTVPLPAQRDRPMCLHPPPPRPNPQKIYCPDQENTRVRNRYNIENVLQAYLRQAQAAAAQPHDRRLKF